MKALAELDGWFFKSRQKPDSGSVMEHFWFSPDDDITPKIRCVTQTMIPSGRQVGNICGDNLISILPPYLTSRDAIVPLVEKFINKGWAYTQFLNKVLGINKLNSTLLGMQAAVLVATPEQLAEALLRSTDRWTE